MNCLPDGNRPDVQGERIAFRYTFAKKYRVFATFIICAALLTAAFAAGGIFRSTETGTHFFAKLEAYFSKDEPTGDEDAAMPPSSDQLPADAPHNCGDTAIIVKDLSYASRGETYLVNETVYQPDVEGLLKKKLTGLEITEDSSAPLVLIVHTHTTESYLSKKQSCMDRDVADCTYSEDTHQNVVAVGRALCDALLEKGIPTLHCVVDHIAGEGLRGSYDRCAQSIESYLKQYPSIRLVIDLHRDAIVTADGEYVQTEVPGDESLAQIMPVVGTDANGTEHPNWEENLALALQLRHKMNESINGICRPVYLRSASYNQELAPYSLLLEVGTGANTVEQAKRTAQRIGDALYELFYFS